MFDGLFSCFRGVSLTRNHKILDEDILSNKSSCVFCDVSVEKGFRVIWQNDTLIAFYDRNAASQFHILVIPKRHVASIKSLRKGDIPLGRSWSYDTRYLVRKVLMQHLIRPMGFHIPPFNSVQHLHLHVQSTPYNSSFRQLKYRMSLGRSPHIKGCSCFVEVDQAVQLLDADNRVGVFPC
ncbi:HIT-like protein [Fistulina hepatica ATCC 64428]|nr:HIT-like protein [Fistulina hepatica ATCC 64428]